MKIEKILTFFHFPYNVRPYSNYYTPNSVQKYYNLRVVTNGYVFVLGPTVLMIQFFSLVKPFFFLFSPLPSEMNAIAWEIHALSSMILTTPITGTDFMSVYLVSCRIGKNEIQM